MPFLSGSRKEKILKNRGEMNADSDAYTGNVYALSAVQYGNPV
jgi:hypothetical protein